LRLRILGGVLQTLQPATAQESPQAAHLHKYDAQPMQAGASA
jgi:hypothetical protein